MLAEGKTRIEIAEALGISRGYVGAILSDPDGVKERARKDRYRGTCEKCGGPTDGSAGPGKAPKVCMDCITGGAEPRPARQRPYRPLRRWAPTDSLAAIISWIEEHGRLPRSTDFQRRELRGEGRPSYPVIVRHLGVREQRKAAEEAEWQRRLRENVRIADRWQSETPWWVGQPHWTDVLISVASHIDAKLVISHRNAFVRREMMEAHGIDRIMASVGELVQQDDWGKLWRLDVADDEEPLVVVEVVNSTAEPDGTFKDYFLRVPPATETARAGVAWSFGVDPDVYDPEVET